MLKLRHNRFLFLSAFVIALLWPLHSHGGAGARLRTVTVALQWVPQSQFAGFYVAQDMGFYKRRGLDVTIRHGGPELNSINTLADGSAQFATTFLTSALRRRDGGLPLVNVCQLVNRSTAMLVVRRESGIRTLDDLNGRKISIWSGDFGVPFQAALSSRNIRPARRYVQNYSANLFLNRGVDACAAMRYNEYHMLFQAGLDPTDLVTFPLSDYGLNVPEDGIYSLERTWRSDPALCRAFAEATMEGWRHAKSHPDLALKSVMQRVGEARIPTNGSHMKWMLEQILPGILPGPDSDWQAGVLSRSEYAKAVNIMKKQGLLKSPPAYEEFCTPGGSRVH